MLQVTWRWINTKIFFQILRKNKDRKMVKGFITKFMLTNIDKHQDSKENFRGEGNQLSYAFSIILVESVLQVGFYIGFA